MTAPLPIAVTPRLAFGLVGARGRRATNQDYLAFCAGPPDGSSAVARGAVAVVADGLGGHLGGREAAEIAVRGFVEGYYGASADVPAITAAVRSLEAINRWIWSMGRRDPALVGMATTFTAVILVARRAHVFHVGDSRAHRLTAGRLETLTRDHVIDTGAHALPLERAVGLDEEIRIDHRVVDLAADDRLLLSSDGLHGVLSPARIQALLAGDGGPGVVARRLTDAALEAGSRDNISALVLEVVALPPLLRSDLADGIDIETEPARDHADGSEAGHMRSARTDPALVRTVDPTARPPLFERNPLLVWKLLSAALATALLVTLARGL